MAPPPAEPSVNGHLVKLGLDLLPLVLFFAANWVLNKFGIEMKLEEILPLDAAGLKSFVTEKAEAAYAKMMSGEVRFRSVIEM